MPIETATAALSTEDSLVARARRHDESAIREIIRQNNRRLFRLARSIVRDDPEAEDIVQETYVRAFTRLAEFRGEARLTTWLTRIALNEAYGRLRRRRPTIEWDSVEAAEGNAAQIIAFPSPSSRSDPERTMAQNDALQRTLIPSATNQELKDLLTTGLKIFQGHEQHAEHVAAEFK